ncbi:MAG TPA: BlaI/MecI/CopY family transcriptional regulator [Steroidobacteraceae bacterium]|nr:BlaI/MecI/CopY family transcriptional regulator [Steroidobacteraceae bacterium]
MTHEALSRRERQIMDIVYRRGEATAAQILDDLSDPPSYSAIRALLRILVDKKHLQHREDGPRYVYSPTLPRQAARARALAQVVNTFFDGSALKAASALLGSSQRKLTKTELDELRALIDAARKRGQ